jgi:SAM-dependent methyltransferase
MGCCDDKKPTSACCGGADDTRSKVRQGYARIATAGGSCCGSTSCCGTSASPDGVARAIGYTDGDLEGLPCGANMGLSCGNPTALASLAEGEVVLDLGAGGGFDCFIAARKVGPSGRVIGVDMTAEMVTRARANVEGFGRQTGLSNVEFRLGEIEHLPVADCSVDVVISNCVINLSPEKPQVWREIARVLRPGARVAVADLALLRPLPEAVRSSPVALVGCVAGAVLVDEMRDMVAEAGLVDAELETDSSYVERMAEGSDPLYREIASVLPRGTGPGDFVTSLKVTARKPR